MLEDETVTRGVYKRTVIKRTEANTKHIQIYNNKEQLCQEVIYSPHGEKSFFRVRRDGTRFQLYQPLPKGIKIKALKGTLRERLTELIPKIVAAANITDPIYCVALAYDDEGNDSVPPCIGIGLESERIRWKTEHAKREKNFVWNPAEFHHYEKPHTQIPDDEALEEACDFLNTKWAEGSSSAPAAKLLEEIAAALNHVAWPQSIRRTDDFVVYAVGLEGSNLRRSLKASLTPEKFGMLKAQGLL